MSASPDLRSPDAARRANWRAGLAAKGLTEKKLVFAVADTKYFQELAELTRDGANFVDALFSMAVKYAPPAAALTDAVVAGGGAAVTPAAGAGGEPEDALEPVEAAADEEGERREGGGADARGEAAAHLGESQGPGLRLPHDTAESPDPDRVAFGEMASRPHRPPGAVSSALPVEVVPTLKMDTRSSKSADGDRPPTAPQAPRSDGLPPVLELGHGDEARTDMPRLLPAAGAAQAASSGRTPALGQPSWQLRVAERGIARLRSRTRALRAQAGDGISPFLFFVIAISIALFVASIAIYAIRPPSVDARNLASAVDGRPRDFTLESLRHQLDELEGENIRLAEHLGALLGEVAARPKAAEATAPRASAMPAPPPPKPTREKSVPGRRRSTREGIAK